MAAALNALGQRPDAEVAIRTPLAIIPVQGEVNGLAASLQVLEQDCVYVCVGLYMFLWIDQFCLLPLIPSLHSFPLSVFLPAQLSSAYQATQRLLEGVYRPLDLMHVRETFSFVDRYGLLFLTWGLLAELDLQVRPASAWRSFQSKRNEQREKREEEEEEEGRREQGEAKAARITSCKPSKANLALTTAER